MMCLVRQIYFIIGILFLIFPALLLSSFLDTKEQYLEVVFLDVGQGDAVLITAPSGNQMLIDAGRDTSVLRALGEVMEFSDREIDVVVATHPDADHIGGFAGVFERYDVGAVVGVNAHNDTNVYEDFVRVVEAEGSEVYDAERGQLIDLGSGVFAQVLFPYEGATITGNDASVVVQLIHDDIEFLLMSDVGKGVEENLVLREGDLLASDVLKVGHHGSKTSTGERFVEVVDPSISLISAGESNRYQHPHPDVLQTLAGVGVPALGTYEEGTITLYSDGQRIWRK